MSVFKNTGAKIYDYLHKSYIKHLTKQLDEELGHKGNNVEVEYPFIIYPPKDVYIGDNTTILKDARINVYNHLTGLNAKIEIGKHCYIGYKFSALTGESIKIGDDVLIASNVTITSENHGMDPESEIPYMDQPLICNPVSIGDGTWIGQNVTILPGVDIGKKCVIAAGSVVTKSVPDYCVAAGVPAKVVKKYDFENHIWIKEQ